MNKGWDHHEKIQAILFSTAARGSHIFRPATQAPPDITVDEEPTDLYKASTAATNMAAAISTASNLAVAATETVPGLMDVDNESRVPPMNPLVPGPPLSFLPSGSGSAGKRTHSVMSFGSEGLQSVSTEITTPPSVNTDPVSKKQAKNSDRSHKSRSSRHEIQAHSHAPGSSKISQASAMVGMQSQISRLTDVFEKSMSTPDDGIGAKRSLAISQIQEEEGLTVQQKVKMISKFQKDISIAETYLELLNGDVRRAWLEAELED
jgi:hypothetical protein